MTLTRKGASFQDETGTNETIVLRVVQAVAGETDAQIASAEYGADAAGNPLPVTVNSDGQSLILKTLQGVNALTVNFVSPSGAQTTVQLVQNGTALSEATLDGHTASTALMIEGT